MSDCTCNIALPPRLLRGVTRTVRVTVVDKADNPVDLTVARNVVVTVALDGAGRSEAYVPGISIQGDDNNVVEFAWYADVQRRCGRYTIDVNADFGNRNQSRVDFHREFGVELVEHSCDVSGEPAEAMEVDDDLDLEGTLEVTTDGMSAFDQWRTSPESEGYPPTEEGFFAWMRQPATDAATAAAAQMSVIQGRADEDHTRAGNDHTRAESDHGTASSDHTRAAGDHTQAGNDHTQAVSDHGTAADDHTLAASDHGTAASDHTLAASDHGTAATDHSNAVSDHTLAASDHSTAAADHTQATADHAVMAGYDTRLGNVEGKLSQLGNEEDIDQNEDGKLQFANRTYNAQQPNGMGYKILRKNASFASQVTETNTIYEIRYDFSLGNASVTIPAGCVLKFNGGSIDNGTLVLDETQLDGDVRIYCAISGTCSNLEFPLSWFGVEETYTLTTSPDDTLVNTEAQATAAANTGILNNIIPFLNANGGTLVIDKDIWINGQISRIYGFSLNCKKTIYYIGEDNINGAVLEVGGDNLTHTVRLVNNWRNSLLKYPEYATNGVWDSSKAYAARKDFKIVGLLVRDSVSSQINIDLVEHFTTNVMVAAGYGSDGRRTFVSYETFDIRIIGNGYRGLVFNFDDASGYVTECKINRGRIWGAGTSTNPFSGHEYGIVFEKSTSGGSASNIVFEQPCVETLYCGLLINNVNLLGCEFKNVRDEGTTNTILEQGTILNKVNKSVYTSYDGYNAVEKKYKTIVYKNTNLTSASTEVIDVNLQVIHGQLNGSNQSGELSVKGMFMLSQDNRLIDGYISSSYKSTVYPNDGIVAFHQYTFPVVVFDNSIGATEFSANVALKGIIKSSATIYVAFFDENGNTVTEGITPPQYFAIGYNRFYVSPQTRNLSLTFTIPSTIKRVAIGVSNVAHYVLSVTSLQRIIKAKEYFVFPAAPAGSVNCDYDGLQYFDLGLGKMVQRFNGRWITENGYEAVASIGSTSERPTTLARKDLANLGFMYFDSTLGKPVYFKTSEETAIGSTNCGKTGLKTLGANTFAQGGKYYIKTIQGSVGDVQSFCFTKASGDLTDAIEIPLVEPVNYSSSYYSRQTQLFTAPDPSVYPYIAINITSTGDNYKFLYAYNITEDWVDATGASV